MFTYPTPETARPAWRDCPGDDALASLYLAVARIQCLEYAPLPGTDEHVELPAPLEVTVNKSGVTGIVTLTRLPGGIIRLDADLTNGSGETLSGGWWELVAPETFRPTLSAAVGTGVVSFDFAPAGTLNLVWGAWEDGAEVAFSIYAAAAQADPEPVVTIPENYFLAIITQARNLLTAGQAPASPGADFDGGSYGITVYPLDWTVKQMLRPEQGIGAIF